MIFVPLDLPPIPNKPELVKRFVGTTYVTGHCGRIEIEKENMTITDRFAHWTDTNLYWRNEEWTDTAKKDFPEIMDWVQTNLPFEKYFLIKLGRLYKADPHVDNNLFWVSQQADDLYKKLNDGKVCPFPKTELFKHTAVEDAIYEHQLANEPVGYRFILSGSRDTLYMSKDQRVKLSDDKKHYCTIPEDTDSYVIDNCSQPHGVDPRPGIDDDRIVGFIIGLVKPKEHKELVQRSAEKYKKYVMTKEMVT